MSRAETISRITIQEDEMRKIIGAVLISMSVTPVAALAQTALETLHFPMGITREAVGGEPARLAASPSAARQQPPRERSWPGRHPVLFGALVGLGTGIAVETAVIPGRSGGEPHSAYIPMFSCVGAGIGSLVGLIVSAARQ